MKIVVIPTNPECYCCSDAQIEVIQCRVQHICEALSIPHEERAEWERYTWLTHPLDARIFSLATETDGPRLTDPPELLKAVAAAAAEYPNLRNV